MATTATAPAPPHATPSDLAQQILTHATPRYTFNFSPFLKRTYNHALDPTSISTQSSSSSAAPATTSGGFNSLVCKHWLRALCKKGEHCEFLHEYNLRKMPECNFFVRNGYCSNGDECLYLHIDPQSKLPPCPWYERGFCPLGPECSKKHVRRKLCVFYLAGFCPEGRDCKEGAHARWEKDDKLPEPVRKSDVVKEEPKREDPMAGGGGYGGYGGGSGGEDDSRDFGGDRGGRFDGRGGGRGGFGNRGGRWRGRGDRKFRGGRGHH